MTEVNTFNYISEDEDARKLLYKVCKESRFEKSKEDSDS